MSENTVHTNIEVLKEKTNKPVHYEYKAVNGKMKTVMGVRKSKKGGSAYSNAFLDLVYLAGRMDPFWMDKLVKDKDFPLFLQQMREAYEKSGIIREGWSPDKIKELEEYASQKISEEATKHD